MLFPEKMKKWITTITMVFVGMFSFANCFGSFGLVKTFYNVNKSIRIGSGLLTKVIQTILMYFPFSILYGVGFFLDLWLFNLVEFWTGSNPVAFNDYDENGKYVKHIENGSESLTLTYLDYGKTLKITANFQGKTEEFYAFQDKEGTLFRERNGEMTEVQVSSQEVGSKTILKLAYAGKLNSTSVVETKDIQDLQKKVEESNL